MTFSDQYLPGVTAIRQDDVDQVAAIFALVAVPLDLIATGYKALQAIGRGLGRTGFSSALRVRAMLWGVDACQTPLAAILPARIAIYKACRATGCPIRAEA
jgi:hypothetical protein